MRLGPLGVLLTITIGCNDQSFKIHEDPPTAAILEPGDGDAFVAGTPVAFRVQLDDNDDGVDALSVAWRSDTLGTLVGESSMDDAIQTFVTTDLVLGTHNVTVTATDPDGQTAEDVVGVVVRENSAPMVAIEHPTSGSEIAEGEELIISVRASDSEESASSLRLKWVVDDVPQIDAPEHPDDSGEATFTVTDLNIGDHNIYVTVTDLAGLSSNDLADFSVLENQPPTIAFTSPAEGEEISVRDDLSVWVSVSDPEEAVESLSLTWTVDGLPQEDAPTHPNVDGTAHLLLPPFEAGEHTIGVSATDAFGGIHSATVRFRAFQPDADGDGFDDVAYGGDDCNDSDSSIHPEADEICDGIDNDCDGLIDDEDAVISGGIMGYVDADGDGFGGGTDAVMRCDASGLVETGGDCDDDNIVVHPGAAETCNGVDDDCDGDVDETLLIDLYTDGDDDGFGGGAAFLGCPDTPDTVRIGGDCDDENRAVNPSATEVCNGVDDDCDGDTDETFLVDLYTDADDDGFGGGEAFPGCADTEGTVRVGGDCDDGNSAINPGASEVCNGLDDDCDGDTDETFLVDLYTDADDDGFGAGDSFRGCADTAGTARIGGDCNDGNRAVNPGASEVCNGIDDDCDGDTDETFLVDLYTDADDDGFGGGVAFSGCADTEGAVRIGGDCNDFNPDVHPASPEVCNGVDDDCDGGVDEALLAELYTDHDDDGYGGGTSFVGCIGTTGTVTTGGDCNDLDGGINPGIPEVCNGIDDDCDGDTDESFLVELYRDFDDDGFGGGAPFTDCIDTPGTVTIGGDCNDLADDINPGMTETCNGIDDDCDDGVDEDLLEMVYTDVDGDGFGTGGPFEACLGKDGTASAGGDCDDSNNAVHPDADEICNEIDDNCDGTADEGLRGTVYEDKDGDGYGTGESYLGCVGVDDAVLADGDCNDLDDDINPDAFEICNDGIDNDCDGAAGVCEFSGANLIDDVASFSAFGAAEDDKIGTSLATADLTGNGHLDLIVGAAFADVEGDHNSGGVYIIEGPLAYHTTDIDDHDTVPIQISGYDHGDLTGYSVVGSRVGEDEYPDLLIGSPGVSAPGGGAESGEVRLFLGPLPADMMGEADFIRTGSADVTINGVGAGGEFGRTITGGDDFDGDGLPDIAISAHKLDRGSKADCGAVYVFLGDRPDWEAGMTLSANDYDAKLYSDLKEMHLGQSLSFVGDTNGDGTDDLLIGAPKAPVAGTKTGSAVLFHGHATTFREGAELRHTNADAWYGGESNGDEAGFSVAGLGDIDEDGRAEFAIGAPRNDKNGDDAGAVYIMLEPSLSGGETYALAESDIQFYGVDDRDRLGLSPVLTADFNNDSVADLILGSPQIRCPAASCGKAFVFYGPIEDIESADLGLSEGSEDTSFRGRGIREFAGEAMLAGHDLSNDGVDDLVISAPGASAGDAGMIHVVFGKGF